MMPSELKEDLEFTVSSHFGSGADFVVPDDTSHGDLTTNLALRLGRLQHKNPQVIAQELADWIANNPAWHGKLTVEVAGAGFVNIRFSPRLYATLAARLLATTDKMPLSRQLDGQTILVEYSQPNIAKPMHFGHLRTTVIGESLKRLLRAVGAQALGINHLGDWGSQFGKLLAAYKRWGDPERLKSGGIQEMLQLYVRFHEEADKDPGLLKDGAEEFAKLERGDEENRQLWQLMRDVSLVEFRRFYARLGIEMDDPERGESDYEPMLAPLTEEAVARGVAQESEGALVIPVGDDIPPMLLRKSDGATIYATRDLATIRYRVEHWQPHRILYVVAADQSLHFQQVFRAASLLGLAPQTELLHIPYGLVNQPDGKKMSTRRGRVIFLDDVLDEAHDRAKQLIFEKSPTIAEAQREKLAEQVGVSAVKYQILHQNRNTTITFELEKIVSLQGDTGPYLQYAFARMQSILTKAGAEDWGLDSRSIEQFDQAELALLRTAVSFPWVLERAAAGYAPNLVAEFAYRLTSIFSTFYEDHPVLQAEVSTKQARLGLVKLVSTVLGRAMQILTLDTPPKL